MRQRINLRLTPSNQELLEEYKEWLSTHLGVEPRISVVVNAVLSHGFEKIYGDQDQDQDQD